MSQDTINFCPKEDVIEDLGKTAAQFEAEEIRNHHIGNSNYSQMPKGYQPWDLWKIFHMNPFYP